ncbi:unnamed protein product [Mytilus coruscus]|uniref:Uncharacterized protein n=1 Tax=Mytilus coruscus TaxID=42192 RepID=A0A6J8DNT0_MYTCO|nr:unnamed protein product [Mytilus coruscus]
MSDSGEKLTVENHTNVQNLKDVNEFSAADAVSLFNTKIDIALDKQRASIVSELQDKLQTNTEYKEGNKIQFSFNQERPRNLDHINKILRITGQHGWGTVKGYADSDITDNSEDASKLRAAIFIAFKKRQTYYARNPPTQSSFQLPRPGVFGGLSNNQLFLRSQNYGQRQNLNPRANVIYHYCNPTRHFAKLFPYTAQLQCRPLAPATVTSPEPFNKQQ